MAFHVRSKLIPLLLLSALIPGRVQAQAGMLSHGGDTLVISVDLDWEGHIQVPRGEGSATASIPWFEGAFLHDTFSIPEFRYSFGPVRHGDNATSVRRLQLEPVSDVNLLQGLADCAPEPMPELRQVSSRKQEQTELRWIPFVKRNGLWYKVLSAEIVIDPGTGPKPEPVYSSRTYKQSSVLASGSWYKVGTSHSGIFRITYADMQSMGFDVTNLDPRNIALYGNGGGMLPETNGSPRADDLVENAIFVAGESDGSFDPGDYVLFYSEGPHTWYWHQGDEAFRHVKHLYDDRNYFFVTVKSDPGLRIADLPAVTGTPTDTVITFNDRKFHELDSNNLIKSGREWFGEEFINQVSYTLPFSFQNLQPGGQVFLRSSVAARSTIPSTFTIKAGASTLTPSIYQISPSYNTDFAIMSVDTMSFSPGADNFDVDITYNSSSASAKGWLNFVELNARRKLSFTGGQMSFRDMASVGSGNMTQFNIGDAPANLNVWDVTAPLMPKAVQGSFLGGSTYHFIAGTDSLREFISFDGSSFFTPDLVGAVGNQNLHGLGQYDMVIVTHSLFREQAERLAQLHSEKDMLSVLVVEPEPIYNEFSSGAKDITAIRDFMKMFYDRAVIPDMAPKYLLLFGDASYDPKDRIKDNTEFIPTFQSSQSLHPAYSYATDDYFGILDDGEGAGAGGHLDVGVGRFPVQTAGEARAMTDKVFRYIDRSEHDSPSGVASNGDWRNMVCFVADDEDGNLHMIQADQLARYVDTAYVEYNIDKIYVDAYQQVSASGGQRYPDAQEAINRRVARGALLVNYTGHGGEVGWALERILEVADINSWENTWNMPAFVTATCEFSRYDDPGRVSAGELVFLNENGGGIGLFTTSRLAFSNSNFNLNQGFFKVALPTTGNHPYTMGDIIRLSKVNAGSSSSNRNFLLIGDPALKLSYPKYRVRTNSVNGHSADTYQDTLRALSTVTITGEVTDWQGVKLSGFNGTIYPTVYDKASTLSTMGNDPTSSPVAFSLQKNIIYKGKVSVTNGEFSFTFVVPKDIAYPYGHGRISYYALDGQDDAHGYYEGFIIGGTSANSISDTDGPSLRLFMNDTNFRDYGITNENPVLLAFISDQNGINTVGNGIGHDIVAFLDGNTSKPYVLNDFYESDLDSYTSGVVRYPLSNLPAGEHVIVVRVWDVLNNSSVDSIHFTVLPAGELVLKSVKSYPNPLSDYTEIWFEHNLPDGDYTAMVHIFDMRGRLVKTFTDIPLGDGFQGGPVVWYGQNDEGSFAGNGMYIYRVSLAMGGQVEASLGGKLILMR